MELDYTEDYDEDEDYDGGDGMDYEEEDTEEEDGPSNFTPFGNFTTMPPNFTISPPDISFSDSAFVNSNSTASNYFSIPTDGTIKEPTNGLASLAEIIKSSTVDGFISGLDYDLSKISTIINNFIEEQSNQKFTDNLLPHFYEYTNKVTSLIAQVVQELMDLTFKPWIRTVVDQFIGSMISLTDSNSPVYKNSPNKINLIDLDNILPIYKKENQLAAEHIAYASSFFFEKPTSDLMVLTFDITDVDFHGFTNSSFFPENIDALGSPLSLKNNPDPLISLLTGNPLPIDPSENILLAFIYMGLINKSFYVLDTTEKHLTIVIVKPSETNTYQEGEGFFTPLVSQDMNFKEYLFDFVNKYEHIIRTDQTDFVYTAVSSHAHLRSLLKRYYEKFLVEKTFQILFSKEAENHKKEVKSLNIYVKEVEITNKNDFGWSL